MSKVVVQEGHVPRTKGATGTHREQEAAKAIGSRLAKRLSELGHTVHLIGADDPVPKGIDVFVALHTDGSVDPSKRGASVGWNVDGGRRLSAAWKRAHQRAGYPAGFLPDNYTANLHGYYGFGRSDAPFEFLAEHATTTNVDDETWLFSHLDEVAEAHVAAIGEIVGHPAPPVIPWSDSTPTDKAIAIVEFDDGRVWTFASDGGVFAEDGAGYFGNVLEAGVKLNGPMVAGLVPAGGKGYYQIGADGGVFTFGDIPVIQPYVPFMQEYAKGLHRIVGAQLRPYGILTVANDGDAYRLTA